MTSPHCFFAGCDLPAVPHSSKCALHHHRHQCQVDGCRNQVYARQLCARHGGKKPCRVLGCSLRARVANLCFQHGANKKKCDAPGCPNPAHARGKCVRHGGGQKCKLDGCDAHARTYGVCRRHLRECSDAATESFKATLVGQASHPCGEHDTWTNVSTSSAAAEGRLDSIDRDILDLLLMSC